MVDIKSNELIFAFPDVNSSAELHVHFRHVDTPEESVPIIQEPIDGGILLAARGRLVMHLRPKVVPEEFLYGIEPQTIRYPFAVLVTVGGINALTGEPSSSLTRSPQNYFASPPQGGIDGYFVRGEVYPFQGCGEAPRDRIRLEIKVFPMKGEMWTHLMNQKRRCGWSPPVITGLTIAHGGERQCEPVYEDLCCIGDWDQSRGENATVWVKGRS